MLANFPSALALVLKSEGGFVDDKRDPGGATNEGVTQRVYDAYRRSKKLPTLSVWHIYSAEVEEIYRAQYWLAIRGDSAPTGVDYCLFDEAVNSGVGKSIVDLQVALGLKADGHFGIVTLDALLAVKDPAALINRICDLRLSFLHRLKTWRFFGKGWSSRVQSVRLAALRMAKGSAIKAVAPQPAAQTKAALFAPNPSLTDPSEMAMTRFVLLLAVLLAIVLPTVAYADTTAATTSITVPVGDWLGAVDQALQTVLLALVGVIVAIVLKFVPSGLRAVLTGLLTPQVEQLLANAIGYGINTVTGAEKGKTLDVNVGNAVAAQALQYATDHGPAWLIQWAGGADQILEKIIARLDLVAGLPAASTVSAPAPPVVPASAFNPAPVAAAAT